MNESEGVNLEAVSLAGKQIVVRDWVLEDLPVLRDWLHPGHEWQKLDGPYYPQPSAEDTERLVERVAERIKSGDWADPRMVLAIADASTNELLGRVSWYWQSVETRWLSAGLVIFSPSNWGRGLGYEALGLWSEYLLAAMPELVRLDLRTWSGNRGMMRLAEKLGYQQEATFRRARIVAGEYYDGLGYGILREEWGARFPSGFSSSL
jgi:RimJ/RimL family protein N-acetyltransferase